MRPLLDLPTPRLRALAAEPEGIASVEPGQQYRILCPFCMGGSSREASLSLRIDDTGRAAVYNCFRATCGESGTVRLRGGQVRARGCLAIGAAPRFLATPFCMEAACRGLTLSNGK